MKQPISNRTRLFKLNTKPGSSCINKAVFLFPHGAFEMHEDGGQTPAELLFNISPKDI